MTALTLLVAAAMLPIVVQAAEGPRTAIVAKDPASGAVHVRVSSKGVAPEVLFDADRVSWSPDGRYLVLGKMTSGALYKLSVWVPADRKSKPELVAEDASWPSWSPSAAALVYSRKDQGVFVWRPSDAVGATRLLPTGVDPSWSPDGERIAFGATGDKAGLWICRPDGAGLRRVVRDLEVKGAKWVWHGRTIAFVATGKETPKPTLFTCSPDGRNLASLGPVDSAFLEWAPSSGRVLAKRAGKWSICDTTVQRWLPWSATGPKPEWLSPSKLLYFESATAYSVDFTREPYPRVEEFWPTALIASELPVACSPYLGTVLQGVAPSPFGEKPSPRPGTCRVVGWVDSVDPFDQRYTVVVKSVTDAKGMETVFGKPVTQTVTLTDGSERIVGDRRVKMRPIDLRQDDEVCLILEGEAVGKPDALPVVSAVIPSLPDTSTTTTPGGEQVPPGMVFPVVGKVKWSDTFGASRDGGARSHQGQDLMAPKMRPLVAAFDGVVRFSSRPGKRSGMMMSLSGDCGWSAAYMHLNIDTPGTSDGKGGTRYAFAPGLVSGDRVRAGQLLGWVGNSGNARSTAPHLHFELYAPWGLVNAAPALRAARHLDWPIYRDAFAQTDLRAGEVRWDGVVKSVDAQKKVVVVELTAKAEAKGRVKPVATPVQAYILVDSESKLAFAGNENVNVTVDDIKPGLLLSAVGTQKSASSVQSRAVTVDWPNGN